MQIKKLKECVYFESFKHDLYAKDLRALECENGSVRLFNAGALEKYTTEEKVGRFLRSGEVILIARGGGLSIKYYKGLFVSANNHILKAKEGVNLSYIYYYLLAHLQELEKFNNGQIIKHLSLEKIKNFEIVFPPLEIQTQAQTQAQTQTQTQTQAQTQAQAQNKALGNSLRLQSDYYSKELIRRVKWQFLARNQKDKI